MVRFAVVALQEVRAIEAHGLGAVGTAKPSRQRIAVRKHALKLGQ